MASTRPARKKTIIEAADCAVGGGKPPRLLVMAWDCKRWGALPEGGGLLDQPAGLLGKMATIENVYDAHRGVYGSSNIVEYGKQNPGAISIVGKVRRLENGTI